MFVHIIPSYSQHMPLHTRERICSYKGLFAVSCVAEKSNPSILRPVLCSASNCLLAGLPLKCALRQ